MISGEIMAAILQGGGVILLVVQFIKSAFGLEGSRHTRAIQLLALLIGMAWGAITLRALSAGLWHDINPLIGGGMLGAIAGMAAVGGKSFTNGVIDRSAEMNAAARAKAGVDSTTVNLDLNPIGAAMQSAIDGIANGIPSISGQTSGAFIPSTGAEVDPRASAYAAGATPALDRPKPEDPNDFIKDPALSPAIPSDLRGLGLLGGVFDGSPAATPAAAALPSMPPHFSRTGVEIDPE